VKENIYSEGKVELKKQNELESIWVKIHTKRVDILTSGESASLPQYLG
jgi:hypothetical protein